ncbi:MAG: globin [Candidatus Nanopelagicales bacterium]
MSSVPPRSPYERFGGAAFFTDLVRGFYRRVAHDPVLLPLYPEADLGPAEDRLRMFLEQYWGGPTTYSQQRGHPRLRMRHAPYPIDAQAHDAWLANMRASLDDTLRTHPLDPADEAELWDYLQRAAHAMVNCFPGPASEGSLA